MEQKKKTERQVSRSIQYADGKLLPLLSALPGEGSLPSIYWIKVNRQKLTNETRYLWNRLVSQTNLRRLVYETNLLRFRNLCNEPRHRRTDAFQREYHGSWKALSVGVSAHQLRLAQPAFFFDHHPPHSLRVYAGHGRGQNFP